MVSVQNVMKRMKVGIMMKKRMNKIVSLMLAAVMTAALMCGCGRTKDNDKEEGKLSVISTIFPPYDFAKEVGGEKADVRMLLQPGTESHTYDPSPQDIINIRNCDLFIYVGGESDEWVREILESGEKKPKKVIALMECVDVVPEEIVEGMQAEEEEGDKIEYDEHVWTSPVNAITITKAIRDAMSELDSANTSYYSANENKYSLELSKLDNDIKKVVDGGKRKTIVFGDRFPFRYFADQYGLTYYAAFPGCSSETEPIASTISTLIEKVKEKKIPVVFTIEFSNGKVADTICSETGAKKLQFHSCHNVSKEMFEQGVTYVSIMNDNLKNLEEALS